MSSKCATQINLSITFRVCIKSAPQAMRRGIPSRNHPDAIAQLVARRRATNATQRRKIMKRSIMKSLNKLSANDVLATLHHVAGTVKP